MDPGSQRHTQDRHDCSVLGLLLKGQSGERPTQKREMCALESFPYWTAHRRVRGRTGAGTSPASAGTSPARVPAPVP
jgi:hypothetical protein